MNENMFANGSVPVKVAARVYGKGNVNEQKRICNERSFAYRVFISGFLRQFVDHTVELCNNTIRTALRRCAYV